MITLQKLKWDNCFSYGSDNELDLDDNTVTQIIGTNGMGKSSIPLIIEEALYNKNSKGIKKVDIPNRHINDGYSISLTFTKDGSTYEITIKRKSSIKVKLEKDGEDISSHTATNTYKTIQRIIGIDFKTFSQLVYQNTNASLQFLTATDANRKKFLIDLLQLEHYVELFDIFKAASKEATSKSTNVSGQLATVEKWLENNKLESTDVLPLLKVESDLEEHEKALRYWTNELEKWLENNEKISKNNQYKTQLDALDIDALNRDTTVLLEEDNIISEIGSVRAVAAGAKTTLSKLGKVHDQCPTCKQSIDNSVEKAMVAVEQNKFAEAKETLDELTKQLKQIKENNQRFNYTKKAIRDWEALYQAYDSSISANHVDNASVEASVRSSRARVQEAKAQESKLRAENDRRNKLNTRLQVIQEQTDDFKAQKEKHKADLVELQSKETTLDILKKAFSTNGLLAYKIENLVKELEELTNEYLAELSDGRFTLEFVVSNDKLNVQITDAGSIIDILALSSGELARVNTATLLAIRQLMSSISKSRINVLFLDEVINVLDETGRERMVEVLLREDLNTYIVSHGWTHPLLEKIEVVKDGNVSVLE
jgi:DNA repair exonuclease SbcCD ATPase subunit